MITAILTDIHANYHALTACLNDAAAHRADHFAFLGDFVGYGPDPAKVLDLVREYLQRGAVAVMGNHDHAVLHEPRKRMHEEAREAIEWTRAHLQPAHLKLLSALPLTAEHEGIGYVHAGAARPAEWEYITDTDAAAQSMRASKQRIQFSGHVHIPALYRLTEDGRAGMQTPGSGHTALLRPQHQYLALPGAVGQPRDANPDACYALFNHQSREVTFRRVPYDVSGAARRIIEVGLPIVFAMRLVEGI